MDPRIKQAAAKRRTPDSDTVSRRIWDERKSIPEALAWSADDAKNLRDRAWALVNGGDFPRALSTLDLLDAMFGSNPIHDVLRAQCFAAQGRCAEAAEAVTLGIEGAAKKGLHRLVETGTRWAEERLGLVRNA
jgi:hypothetical protein